MCPFKVWLEVWHNPFDNRDHDALGVHTYIHLVPQATAREPRSALNLIKYHITVSLHTVAYPQVLKVYNSKHIQGSVSEVA